MLGISSLIKKVLGRWLHQHREPIVDKWVNSTIENFSGLSIDAVKLRELLNIEADRIYPMVDHSVLEERIKRAKYTFWCTVIPITIVIGVIFAVLPNISPLIFVTPLLGAVCTWANSIGTVKISYDERVEGAMKSVTDHYIKIVESGLDVEEKKQESSYLAILEKFEMKFELKFKEQAQQLLELKSLFIEHCSVEKKSTLLVPAGPADVSANDNTLSVPEVRITCSP